MGGVSVFILIAVSILFSERESIFSRALSPTSTDAIHNVDISSDSSTPNFVRPYRWTSAPRKIDPGQVGLPRISSIEPIDHYQTLLEIPTNVRTVDAVTFSVDKSSYRVAGIRSIPLRMVCTNPDGRRWSCGQHGRMALRSLLVGKALQCLPLKADVAAAEIDCRLSGAPLGALIVGSGWATPTAPMSDVLAQALARARTEKAGAWASLEGVPD